MSGDPEGRPTEIKRRRLEIAVALAESKAAHFNAVGTPLSLAERSSLEAEDARLALEAHNIKGEHNAAKIVRHLVEQHSFTTELLKLLAERGLSGLVLEANSRAIQTTLAALKPAAEA